MTTPDKKATINEALDAAQAKEDAGIVPSGRRGETSLTSLTKKFPQEAIKQRELTRGGRRIAYVPGYTVIHRLNDATNNQWDMQVKSITTTVIGKDGENSLITAHVALTLPGLGTREHIGVQKVNERGGEDLVKGAITDALKKAATLFGVGLELYGEDYEDDDHAASAPQPAARSGKPAPAPQANPAPAAARAPEGRKTMLADAWLKKLRDIAAEHAITPLMLNRLTIQQYDEEASYLSKEDAIEVVDVIKTDTRAVWEFIESLDHIERLGDHMKDAKKPEWNLDGTIKEGNAAQAKRQFQRRQQEQQQGKA